jgi:CNT family concentrative nucleoside transporter
LLPEAHPGRPDEIEVAETFEEGERPANIIMAAGQGAQTGVKLAVAVGAMVLAFVALVALGERHSGRDRRVVRLSRTQLPADRRLGVPADHVHDRRAVERGRASPAACSAPRSCSTSSSPSSISATPRAGAADRRSRAIVTFALCGFANFSSIAIQMAVTGGLAPNQRPVIARLGIKALIAGSLANLMSAALAGLMLSL